MRLIDKSSPILNRPGARLFQAPTGQPEAVKFRQVGVVGMPSDWTHSSRIGTRFGPDSLRRSTSILQDQRPKGRVFDPDLNLWSVPSKDWIIDCGDASIRPDDVTVTTEAIARMTEAITRNGGVPLALGGDHYNSYPACLGFSRGLSVREPNARVGFIQIDGHLDFSDRLGAWGSYNHATNARRISELPNVSINNMVWIGVTGWVDSNEVHLIESQGGKIFSSRDVHRLGASEVAKQALSHCMENCDYLYLSIDVDAMDAGYLPGTGSIVHSGITPRQYYDLLDTLAAVPPSGLDIAEVSPPLDPSGRSDFIAAEMLFRILRAFRCREEKGV